MPKKIFTSYSWDNEGHKKWVAKLTNDLRSKYGFEATCDTIRGDGELDTMIVDGITKSDKIIVVITPDYTYKAENYIGGVGKETKLLHTRFFKDDKSIVPILKEKTKTPAYLDSVPYIDFTVGNYNDNLNELVKRLNNETTYKAETVSKNPLNSDDYDLIPDLRINDPNAEEIFLNEEFNAADKRILSLVESTKKQYPAFQYERSTKTDVVSSNSASYINGQFIQHKNQYRVVTYKVVYNGKIGSVRFWLDYNQSGGFGKGIFGLFDESFRQCGYNSHNFGVTINRSGKNLELNAYMIFAQQPIKSGKQLGEYIFKTMMERVKQ
jgi:hypothetical protein